MEDAYGVYFKTDWNKFWNNKKGVFIFKQKCTNDAFQLSDKKLFDILELDDICYLYKERKQSNLI